MVNLFRGEQVSEDSPGHYHRDALFAWAQQLENRKAALGRGLTTTESDAVSDAFFAGYHAAVRAVGGPAEFNKVTLSKLPKKRGRRQKAIEQSEVVIRAMLVLHTQAKLKARGRSVSVRDVIRLFTADECPPEFHKENWLAFRSLFRASEDSLVTSVAAGKRRVVQKWGWPPDYFNDD